MSLAPAVAQLAQRPDSAALAHALRNEARLLGDLLGVVLAQRAGVASEDVQAVDDSVYAAHRVLRTLEEARRRRRSLLALCAGAEDVPLETLELTLETSGQETDAALWPARDELLDAARRLAREIAVNRRILRQALSTGEARIRTLCGVPAGAGGSAAGGLLVNRTV